MCRALGVERVIELGKWKCGCIIGNVVVEEDGVDCIVEWLALRANVLDTAIVDGGVVYLLWGDWLGKAQIPDGRLCVWDVGEIVIASGYLGIQVSECA